MLRFSPRAGLLLLTLAAACVLPTTPGRVIVAEVQVSTHGRGADSTHVQATFIALSGGERIDFRSDTLRVQNAIGTRTQKRQFSARVPLDSAVVANGLGVRLPVPTLGAVPFSNFTVYSVARRGSPSMTLRARQDLVLPIFPGSSGTLPAPGYERWHVSFTRGGPGFSISGEGPLPSPILIPWELIPTVGSDTMQVRVFSSRDFRVSAPPAAGSAPRLLTEIRADANLEWVVLIVP